MFNVTFPSFSTYFFTGVYWKEVISIEDLKNNSEHFVKSEFFMEITNFTTSSYLLCPKNTSGAEPFYVSTLAREYSRFLHLKDVFCTPAKALAINDKLVKLYDMFSFVKRQKPTKTCYDSIIFLYSSYGNVFGHFLHDSMATLLKMPQDLINKSMIMLSFPYNIAAQYFDLFGIDKKKIIENKKYWYHAKDLYLFYPCEDVYGYIGCSFTKVVDLLREKTGVNSIIGYRYIFVNRPKGTFRHVTNLKELYFITLKILPEINWEIDEDPNYLNLLYIAKEFASYKMMVAPSGSNTVNMLYMNRNYSCGICLIHAKTADYPIYANSLMAQIWAIGFCNNWTQFDIGIHYCDIPYGLTCIKRLVYALKYHRWPESCYNDMFEAFDFQTIYNITLSNLRLSRLISVENGTFTYPLNKQTGFGFL